MGPNDTIAAGQQVLRRIEAATSIEELRGIARSLCQAAVDAAITDKTPDYSYDRAPRNQDRLRNLPPRGERWKTPRERLGDCLDGLAGRKP